MIVVDPSRLAIAFGAAFLAGAINSVAGGGTMISFPVLIALGLPPVIANATSTIGIWPGSLGSVWGFRRELARVHPRMFLMLIPAAIGGGIGALLLRLTPGRTFEQLVPLLLLFATILFMIQSPVQRWLRSADAARQAGTCWLGIALVAQFLVAVYGGYFGAGMSIMNLSILGIIGMTDILEMNGMTSLVSCVINAVAGTLFVVAGLISWPFALVMTVGALVGGYGAAGVARRIGRPAVRAFVICVGLTLAAYMAYRIF